LERDDKQLLASSNELSLTMHVLLVDVVEEDDDEEDEDEEGSRGGVAGNK
jgi:hypothetical protein